MTNVWARPTLLSLLFTFGHCVFISEYCSNYTNVTDAWRNYKFTSVSFPGYPKDDAHLVGKWFRFTGIGGDVINPYCKAGPGAGGMYTISRHGSHSSIYSIPTALQVYHYRTTCYQDGLVIQTVRCPHPYSGSFYIYNIPSHPFVNATYGTYHLSCKSDSCGPLAECATGGCTCVTGYEIPHGHLPTPDSHGCADIDECETMEIDCGPNADCSNTPGSYLCVCMDGFGATLSSSPVSLSNKCKDINECLDKDICGEHGECDNTAGSYVCECDKGYDNEPNVTAVCEDVDECLKPTVCGPYASCNNTVGAFTCECQSGFEPKRSYKKPSAKNICTDINECYENATICGPSSKCINTAGSYNCTCDSGYRLSNADAKGSPANPCIDIDECSETPGICGRKTVCTNVMGKFYCSCPDGFYPSTGILWIVGVSFCENLQEVLDRMEPKEGQTKRRAFLDYMDTQLYDNEGMFLPDQTVINCFSASMEVSGVGPRATSSNVSSEGEGETANRILKISERLLSATADQSWDKPEVTLKSQTVDLSLRTVGLGRVDSESGPLSANGNAMEMNLTSLAENNNGSAAAAFMVLNGMESLLSHRYFKSENVTEMFSDIISVILPSVNNTNLSEPVNFTIKHKKKTPPSGFMTCVYWEGHAESSGGEEEGSEEKAVEGSEEKEETMRWSEKGCWVSHTSDNFTVCSCSHLSTFALIMQIGEPPPDYSFLEWLNRICVIVGLFFFGLSIFTFLLCSWNPKINNTARLHLCLNLGLSHLLMLWNDRYTDHELACTVMAGLLHFLIVGSFVWMLLEALQLYLLVQKLSKVKVIRRDGLPRPILYFTGYGVPFVVVGVSALVYSDGYGATEAEVCWLSRRRGFNWALTGPVIAIIGLNWMLFCATLWSLRPTLANMKSNVSQSRDTRLIVFKILAQFVILGCTWILGLYQQNLFFQVLFIFMNSQQGTFLFIVHCVLNKEVREEYIKWLTCSFSKDPDKKMQKEATSVSEDLDKPKEKTK